MQLAKRTKIIKIVIQKQGKKLIGNNMPTNIDFEKSGLGNNNNPTINPVKIDIQAFFSLIDLL